MMVLYLQIICDKYLQITGAVSFIEGFVSSNYLWQVPSNYWSSLFIEGFVSSNYLWYVSSNYWNGLFIEGFVSSNYLWKVSSKLLEQIIYRGGLRVILITLHFNIRI